MKRILTVAVMVMAAFSLALSQTTSNKTTRNGGDEQAVQKFMDEFNDASKRNDTAALGRYMVDDYTFVTPFGGVATKAAMKSGNAKYESISVDEGEVRIYGNTAVTTRRLTMKGQIRERNISGQYRVTSVLIKKEGRWQLVAEQATRIAQP